MRDKTLLRKDALAIVDLDEILRDRQGQLAVEERLDKSSKEGRHAILLGSISPSRHSISLKEGKSLVPVVLVLVIRTPSNFGRDGRAFLGLGSFPNKHSKGILRAGGTHRN